VTGCDEEVEEVLPGTILGLTLLRSISIIKSTRCEGTRRSSSPEHSGIPAIPVVITARRPPTEQGYTSDESIQQPRRRERRVDRVSWA